MVAVAYLSTTAERVKDMTQKPVYILNHASSRTTPRSLTPTLDEVEAEVYYHIGEREDLDKKYALAAGLEFLWPHEAIMMPWFLPGGHSGHL